MREIEITYTAYDKVFTKRYPYDTPIGVIHSHLADLCSTYHIVNLQTIEP